VFSAEPPRKLDERRVEAISVNIRRASRLAFSAPLAIARRTLFSAAYIPTYSPIAYAKKNFWGVVENRF
jgi:hypothetical protein